MKEKVVEDLNDSEPTALDRPFLFQARINKNLLRSALFCAGDALRLVEQDTCCLTLLDKTLMFYEFVGQKHQCCMILLDNTPKVVCLGWRKPKSRFSVLGSEVK